MDIDSCIIMIKFSNTLVLVIIIFTGVMVAFSQSTFTASEGDGIVPVCAELLTGESNDNYNNHAMSSIKFC